MALLVCAADTEMLGPGRLAN